MVRHNYERKSQKYDIKNDNDQLLLEIKVHLSSQLCFHFNFEFSYFCFYFTGRNELPQNKTSTINEGVLLSL